MSLEVDINMGAISAGVNRIDKLYANLAQFYDTPYGNASANPVLYVLYLHGSITQKRISEICEIPKQTVNNTITQLKKDKHIILITNSEDKREKHIELTDKGKRYCEKMLAPFLEINQKLGERVGLPFITQIVNDLKTVGDALEQEIELKAVELKWKNKST